LVLPQVTETLLHAIGINEHFLTKLCGIKWHSVLQGVSCKCTELPDPSDSASRSPADH
jgi:hypothetical protein